MTAYRHCSAEWLYRPPRRRFATQRRLPGRVARRLAWVFVVRRFRNTRRARELFDDADPGAGRVQLPFRARLWIFAGAQYALFALQQLLALIADDVPRSVAVQLAREAYVIDQLFGPCLAAAAAPGSPPPSAPDDGSDDGDGSGGDGADGAEEEDVIVADRDASAGGDFRTLAEAHAHIAACAAAVTASARSGAPPPGGPGDGARDAMGEGGIGASDRLHLRRHHRAASAATAATVVTAVPVTAVRMMAEDAGATGGAGDDNALAQVEKGMYKY